MVGKKTIPWGEGSRSTGLILFFAARLAFILILLIGMLEINPAEIVLANTLVVTTTSDSGSGSLRETIASAVSGDTIAFHPSLAGQTIILNSQLVIDKDLTIDGSSLSSRVSLSGNNSVGVLRLTSGVTALLGNLIIKNGTVSGVSAGINNDGAALTVRNSLLPEKSFWLDRSDPNGNK